MNELREAILAVLRNDARLREINCAIYDVAPRGALMPYIDLGGETEHDDSYDCVDGLEVTVRIRVYARQADAGTKKSSRSMAPIIRRVLNNQEIAVSGHGAASFTHVTTQYDLELNDTNDTAVVMFKVLIEAA